MDIVLNMLLVNALISANGLNFPAITNIGTFFVVIAEAIGIPYLAWAIITLARAYKRRDQGGVDGAIDDIIVGAILVGGGIVLSFITG